MFSCSPLKNKMRVEIVKHREIRNGLEVLPSMFNVINYLVRIAYFSGRRSMNVPTFAKLHCTEM